MVTTMGSNTAPEADDRDVLPDLVQNEQQTSNISIHPHVLGLNHDAEPANNDGEIVPDPISSYPGNSLSSPLRRQLRSLQLLNEEQARQVHAAQNQDQNMEEDHADTADPVSLPLTGIEACIDRIIRNPILVRDSNSRLDTFIYIGRLCLQNRDLEDQLQEYFCNHPILVERSKLEALNSPYFNKCFTGIYQTRKWKALKDKIALHVLPAGINYIINLTPAIEGNEAVQSIQDLSCPFGVLHWKKSRTRWANHASLVGGLDENDGDVSPDAVAMEYSCVRHVKSIERFMTALQGNDPKFDSAPKLYTAVMVSGPWGIQAQHPLTDYVARWLCDHDGNSNFVEAFPEIVLKMADVLKCAPLCQDAFSILVGEAALDSIITHPFGNGTTVYERVRGDIEEDWLSRIQHARNSFIDRVKNAFNSLAGEHMEWVASLSSVQVLRLKARQSGRLSEFDAFLHLLKRFIRGSIYKLLCDDYDLVNVSGNVKSIKDDGLYPSINEENVWSTLRAPERIFAARFWRVALNCYLRRDRREHLTNHYLIKAPILDRGLSLVCAEYAGGPLMEDITIKSLIEALPVHEPTVNPFQIPTAKRNSSGIWFNPVQSTTKNVPTTNRIPQTLNTAWSTGLSVHDKHSQGGALPIRMPSFPNFAGQDYSKLPVATCSRIGCSENFHSLLPSNSCTGCRLNFCNDHIAQWQHRCYALNVVQTFHEQERQPSIHSDTESSDGYDTPNQDNEYDRNTVDPAHSIPTRHQRLLPLAQEILISAVKHIQEVSRQMLSGMAGGNLGTLDSSHRIAYTLNCLNEDEIKFLPLWAEGLDDGTGGVFGEHIPSANEDDLAFKSNGRRLVTRSEGSDYSFVSETVDSTVNTSTIAHDGYRDTLPRGRVVAMDETDSSSEGGWSYIQDTIGDKKGKAPATYTREASEVATTLGAFEDASVIDQGVKSSRTNFNGSMLDEEDMEVLSFTASSPGTIREADNQDDTISEDLEDSYNGFDGEDFDDDMDMMFDDDLVEAGSSKQTNNLETKTVSSDPFADPFSVSTWSEPKSMAGVSYVYKNESDYDLMTRP